MSIESGTVQAVLWAFTGGIAFGISCVGVCLCSRLRCTQNALATALAYLTLNDATMSSSLDRESSSSVAGRTEERTSSQHALVRTSAKHRDTRRTIRHPSPAKKSRSGMGLLNEVYAQRDVSGSDSAGTATRLSGGGAAHLATNPFGSERVDISEAAAKLADHCSLAVDEEEDAFGINDEAARWDCSSSEEEDSSDGNQIDGSSGVQFSWRSDEVRRQNEELLPARLGHAGRRKTRSSSRVRSNNAVDAEHSSAAATGHSSSGGSQSEHALGFFTPSGSESLDVIEEEESAAAIETTRSARVAQDNDGPTLTMRLPP